MHKLKELDIKNIIYSNDYGKVTICKTIHYFTDKRTIGRRLIQE